MNNVIKKIVYNDVTTKIGSGSTACRHHMAMGMQVSHNGHFLHHRMLPWKKMVKKVEINP